MKEIRNLSGIYFRSQNLETKKWENVCFEDLPEDEQNSIMERESNEWLKSMIKQLSNTINKIGEQFDIMAE